MLDNLIPWNKKNMLKKGNIHPLVGLHRDVNRLFEDFFGEEFPLLHDPEINKMMLSPKFDVTESNKSIEITAELAGVNEKDLDVSVDGNVLTVKGEKKEEVKEDKKDYHLSERRYGSFMRVFPLPDGLELDKIEASFKNGVLKVALPKNAEAKSTSKKIHVTS
jgi:HSP20 family protein